MPPIDVTPWVTNVAAEHTYGPWFTCDADRVEWYRASQVVKVWPTTDSAGDPCTEILFRDGSFVRSPLTVPVVLVALTMCLEAEAGAGAPGAD